MKSRKSNLAEQVKEEQAPSQRNSQGEIPLRPDSQFQASRKKDSNQRSSSLKENKINLQTPSPRRKDNPYGLDALTEFAMIREGITIEDILEK